MSTNDVNSNRLYIELEYPNSTSSLPNSSSPINKNSESINLGNQSQKLFSIIKVPKTYPQVKQSELDPETDRNDQSDDSAKLNPNSLISISKEVLKYLSEKKVSKGTDVTKYILLKLNVSQDDQSFKNIQRRVYDAINVMNAIGILDKDKNSLYFKGHSNFKKIFYKSSLQNRNSIIKEKLNFKADRINTKQHELMALALKVRINLTIKFYLSKKLQIVNQSNVERKFTCEKIDYPFNLIKLFSDAAFVIKEDDCNSRLCILSDKPLKIINEEDIMKNILKKE
jgi:hypothetical protein